MWSRIIQHAAAVLLQRLPVVAPRKMQPADANLEHATDRLAGFHDLHHVARVGIGAVVLVMVVVFIGPKLKGGSNGTANVANLPCLLPNVQLALHWHPELKILVDGEQEALPADLGLEGSCPRPIHTHDTTGIIHIEAQVVRDYLLGEFFGLWGKTIDREGYDLVMTVDEKPSLELGNLVMKDGQKIVLSYTKKSL